MKLDSAPIPEVAYEAPVIIDAADLAGVIGDGCAGTCCTGGNGVVEN